MDPLRRAAWEKSIAISLAKEHQANLAKLLRLMEANPSLKTVPPSFWTGTARSYYDALEEPLRNVFLESADALYSDLPVDADWDLVNEAAAEWSRNYSYHLVDGITATQRQVCQEKISQFWEEETTFEDLAGQLGVAFSAGNALRIAVTEVTRAATQGEFAIAARIREDNPDINLTPFWVTNNDELVCDVCGERDGEPIEDEADGPPAHPFCRCWVNHTVEGIEGIEEVGDDESRELTPEQKQRRAERRAARKAAKKAALVVDPLAAQKEKERKAARRAARRAARKAGVAAARTPPRLQGVPMTPEQKRAMIEEALKKVLTDGSEPSKIGFSAYESLLQQFPGLSGGQFRIIERPLNGSSDPVRGDYNYWESRIRLSWRSISGSFSTGDRATSASFTFWHEFGHLTDATGLLKQVKAQAAPQGRAPSGSYASHLRTGGTQLEAAISKWYKAVTSSKTYRHLKAIHDSGGHKKWIEYATTAHELWARTFAQYVAYKVGDPRVNEYLARKGRWSGTGEPTVAQWGPHPFEQWNPDDFIEISKAFDELFAEAGWSAP